MVRGGPKILQDKCLDGDGISEVWRSFLGTVLIECQVITLLLWLCIAALCDWLKYLAPLFQPIRSWSPFPALGGGLHVLAMSSDWFIELTAPVIIGS